MDITTLFYKAAEAVKTLKQKPDDSTLLELYAYYKQATVGDNDIPKPTGLFDLKGKAKWNAWESVRGMSKLDAMKSYIALVNSLFMV